ncbi:hypothetical protein [Pantoea sp.]|uniref:hypothetical protein n=1 Tax=Pantoea sp. TaxID=69393 RepID=UPI00289D4705|nr:hypothetical protein [Pantoea sp.]
MKTQDAFNRTIIDAVSQLTSHYNIKRSSYLLSDNIALYSRVIMHPSSQPKPIDELENIQAQREAYDNTLSILTSNHYREKVQHKNLGQQRATMHSKSIKHNETLKENMLIVNAMNTVIVQAGKKVFWLTPPFPENYLKNINPEMKLTHRDFFYRASHIHSTFIDLSENKDFQHRDFRDGDHLNFNGAAKLVKKLRRLHVPV